MMGGRKPVPAEIRAMTGNASSHPPANAKPHKNRRPMGFAPRWMTPLQKEIWEEGRKSAPIGVLRELDSSIFQAWVIAQSNLRRASEQFEEEGAQMVVFTVNGNSKPNPLLQIINRENQVIIRTAAEMGFTPSAKMRVPDGGKETDEPENPFNQFTPPAKGASKQAPRQQLN